MTEVQTVIDRIQAHQKEQGFCLGGLGPVGLGAGPASTPIPRTVAPC